MMYYAFENNSGVAILTTSENSVPQNKRYIEVEAFELDPDYTYVIDWNSETLRPVKKPDPIPEPEPETDDVWAQLANAIKEGVNEV